MKYAKHKYFTIEWKKDSKLYLVDVARFHKFAAYLATNHAEGYLKCKNQYNTDTTPGEWVACTTERPWYSAPINWTIDSGIGFLKAENVAGMDVLDTSKMNYIIIFLLC